MSSADRWRPSLPDGLRIYAVSDIHGCADLLERAFRSIDIDLQHNRAKHVLYVFLGDYIDRGLDSRRTLDLLIERARRDTMVFLKGNHEDVLLSFLQDPTRLHDWRQFGGLQTLVSYGLRPPLNPSASEQLDLAKAFAAALSPDHKSSLDEQEEEDLLWIRDEFLTSELDIGKFIIHGHTPVREPDLRRYRLNIDTGAYATGRLTLLRLEGAEFEFLDV